MAGVKMKMDTIRQTRMLFMVDKKICSCALVSHLLRMVNNRVCPLPNRVLRCALRRF